MFRVLVSCLDRSSLDHGSCLDQTCSGTFNGCTRFSSRILHCNKKTNVILVWVKSELYILSSWIDFLETLLVVWVTVMHFKMTSHLCYLGCSTHLFDGCGSTSRTRRPATPQKLFRNGQGIWQWAYGADLQRIQIPRSRSSRASLPEQVRSKEAAPSTAEVSKDPAPKPWCQTPQDTPKRWSVCASTGQNHVRSMVGPVGHALVHSVDSQGFPAEHCIETRWSMFKLHIRVN